MTDLPVAVVGVAISIGGLHAVLYLNARVDILSALPDDGTGTLRSDLLKWLLAGVVVGYVLLVEGRGLASIGVEGPAPLPFAGWVIAGTAGTIFATAVTYTTYDALDLTIPKGFVEDQLQRPAAARAFTALTAGVTETVLYQAYPIERLAPLLGSLPAAAAVSFLAFTAAHYVGDTFSPAETVYIGVPALCMTVLWVLTRNFFVVATVHALVDGLSLLSARDDGEQPADPSGPAGADAAPD